MTVLGKNTKLFFFNYSAFVQQYNTQTHQHSQYVDRSNNKHSLSPAVPHQSYAKALYNYTSSEAGLDWFLQLNSAPYSN